MSADISRIPSAAALAIIATLGGHLQQTEAEVTDAEQDETKRR